MLYDNFAMLTKRELLIRIVKLLKEENLVDGVKYIPCLLYTSRCV